MLTRMIDFLKNEGITAVFTSLTRAATSWNRRRWHLFADGYLVAAQMLESRGERNRLLYVLKSRGMAHSNQMREFLSLIEALISPMCTWAGVWS